MRRTFQFAWESWSFTKKEVEILSSGRTSSHLLKSKVDNNQWKPKKLKQTNKLNERGKDQQFENLLQRVNQKLRKWKQTVAINPEKDELFLERDLWKLKRTQQEGGTDPKLVKEEATSRGYSSSDNCQTEIYETLTKMPKFKSPGLDGIPHFWCSSQSRHWAYPK